MFSLYYNGCIHSLDKNQTQGDALLIQSNRIIYIGKKEDVNLPSTQVREIDLRRRHVFPGFIDCHTHIASVALDKERVRLDSCQSLADVFSLLRSFVKRSAPGEWILGGGWNANKWKDGVPDRSILDRLFPENPVALYSKDGHAQWLNSQALQLCGFNESSADIQGGKLGRDENGQLTGIVYEKYCFIVDGKAERVPYEALERGMRVLCPELHKLGITSVHSCESLEKFGIFQRLQLSGRKDIRICMHPPADKLEVLRAAGLYSSWGNDWLRLGGLKYFVDGSLGSQTAEMFNMFEGLDHAGVEVIPAQELTGNLCSAASVGWGATVHAIGDKANFKTLDSIQAARKIASPIPLRHRIEHAQILQTADIPRFREYQVIASMQPLHIADDVKIAEKYLGSRARFAYPVQSLIQAGVQVVFGSDMPIADPDPIKGIQSAVLRKYQLDPSEPVWNENECITPLMALLAYTRDAAYASYEESVKGTLEVGKLADFVVMNMDITTEDIKRIPECRVEMTVLDGKTVFNRDDSSAN